MRTEVSTQGTEARNYDAAFSSDGTKIAFTSFRDGNSEIYTMNARDGSKQQNRTKNAAYDFAPDWGGLLLVHIPQLPRE